VIPDDIRRQITPSYARHKDEKPCVRRNLITIGLDPDSEIGEFYFEYDPTLIPSRSSNEQLEDIITPRLEGATTHDAGVWESPLGMATKFIHEVWGLPSTLICMTTTEGEGGYLCEKESGVVFDFDLADRSALIAGRLAPRWTSFYDFLRWYIG
jgi:hypothetical protein